MNLPVTFAPGPSYITPKTLRDITEIANSGFLSCSHRSPRFVEVSKQAIEGLRKHFKIPDDYRIFYQFSATSAMDTILKNIVHSKSFHFAHGAFSNLFYNTALDIGLKASAYQPVWDQAIDWRKLDIPDDVELISVTHNETSTGLMWPDEELRAFRKAYPKQIIALDVTSTFGSVSLDWNSADVWLGSIQKCLGLPSGLGYIIVNPRAFEIGKTAKNVAAWQSFNYLNEKMKVYQTPETPNMMAIALLAKQMQHWDLEEIERTRDQKVKLIYDLPSVTGWSTYVQTPEWRSSTVACFKVDDPVAWKNKVLKNNMVLGEGYAPLKGTTIRIANFPAVTASHLQKLRSILQSQ